MCYGEWLPWSQSFSTSGGLSVLLCSLVCGLEEERAFFKEFQEDQFSGCFLLLQTLGIGFICCTRSKMQRLSGKSLSFVCLPFCNGGGRSWSVNQCLNVWQDVRFAMWHYLCGSEGKQHCCSVGSLGTEHFGEGVFVMLVPDKKVLKYIKIPGEPSDP